MDKLNIHFKGLSLLMGL